MIPVSLWQKATVCSAQQKTIGAIVCCSCMFFSLALFFDLHRPWRSLECFVAVLKLLVLASVISPGRRWSCLTKADSLRASLMTPSTPHNHLRRQGTGNKMKYEAILCWVIPLQAQTAILGSAIASPWPWKYFKDPTKRVPAANHGLSNLVQGHCDAKHVERNQPQSQSSPAGYQWPWSRRQLIHNTVIHSTSARHGKIDVRIYLQLGIWRRNRSNIHSSHHSHRSNPRHIQSQLEIGNLDATM